MNELFAADPKTFSNSTELRFFLKHFGPFVGRYLVSLPLDWKSEVDAAAKNWGDLERSRVSAALTQALRNGQLVRENWPWSNGSPWTANIVPFLVSTPPKLDGVVLATDVVRQDVPRSYTMDRFFDLPVVAEEAITSSPTEYVRVCRNILLSSEELTFVDPYLNLCSGSVYAVMRQIFECIAIGKAKKVTFWLRASEVLDPNKGGHPLAVFKAKAQQLLDETIKRPQRKLVVNMLDDRFSRDRLHRRYVLSIKGGVWVEQGFQQLPDFKKVPVGPIAESIHEDLIKTFLEGKHGFKVAHTFTLDSCCGERSERTA